MFSSSPDITKEFVLSRITEEDIFFKYLSIIPNTTDYFHNPLRTDSHADCRFYRDYRGVLKFNDFAYKVNLDCFNVVQRLYSCGFHKAVEIVCADFELLGTEINKDVIENLNKELARTNKSAELRIKRKDFTVSEIEWWKSQGIHMSTLEHYNVRSLLNIWYNGNLIYSFKKSDPGYAYWFGEYDYKCYFPSRTSYRFLQNSNTILQGYNQLPETGDFLIIGKSLKDVMNKYQYDIPSIAPLSETTILTDEQYADLSERFFHIFTLYDRDRAGMIGALKMKKRFGIKPLLFGEALFKKKDEPKDFTEHHIKYGTQYMLDLIEEAKYNNL